MAKKARKNLTKQPYLSKVSKKTGRSSGSLVDGTYGGKVTPKVFEAQQKNAKK
jgi:hypothetical protein